jgi:hypothetical protein
MTRTLWILAGLAFLAATLTQASRAQDASPAPATPAADTKAFAFNAAADLAAWQTTGDVAPDEAQRRGDAGQSLRVGPGGKAVYRFRDEDAGGRVSLWVYEDQTKPADAKARRVGPRWGLIAKDGRCLTMGVIYAPYLGGDTTYAASDYGGDTWFAVQYSRLKREPGWHEWTFDFDPAKGLSIRQDGKKTAAFDWNRTKMEGFCGVVLFGDDGKEAPQQTIWVDDVTVAPGGPMQVKPVPPPPPPPVVPETDDPVENPPAIIAALAGKHPRLLFDAAGLEAIKRLAESDAGKPFFEQLLAYLPACVPPGDTKYLADATDAQRQGMWRLPTVALHAAMTGDAKSVERGIGFLRAFAAQENWETGSERDCGMGAANILVGAALGYDWLYDRLDPEFREAFRRKLLLMARRMAYGGHEMRQKSTHYWQQDPQNNHRWHRDAGLALAALAVAGDGPGDAWLLARLKKELDFIHEWLPPDGSCHESPSYMIFGGPYLMLAMHASDRCLGTAYLDHPYFKHTPLFRMHTLAPGLAQAYTYGDGGGTGFINNYHFQCTGRHRLADLQAGLLASSRADKDAFQYGWTSLVWFDATVTGGSLERIPTAALFPDLGVASMRDSWGDGGAAALFKCGPYGGRRLNEYRNANEFRYINVAHDDPDANMFVLFAGGAFLAETDRYASKAKLTSSHNTILVNGKGQRGEGKGWTQPLGKTDMLTLASIVTWKDTGDVVVTEGEAGGAYPDLDAFRRAFIWVKGGYVLVLDDIRVRGGKEAEVTWLVQGPDLVPVDGVANAWRLVKGDASCPLGVAADRPFQAAIVDSTAAHRDTSLGYKQLQLRCTAPRWRVACVYDLWNRGNVALKATAFADDAVTLTVAGPGFEDAWTWRPATDAATPSVLEGKRAGGFAVTVGPADKAPAGGPPVAR